MDFGHNIILNYSKPKDLTNWKVEKVVVKNDGKDSFFMMDKSGTMKQMLRSQDVKYMPKKYKLALVASVPKNTNYFKQFIHGHLRLYRKDLTFSNYTAIFSPSQEAINEKQIFTCYLDVKPTPEVTKAEVFFTSDEQISVYSVTLQPSIDIDPSIQESIQSSLPSLIYYYNHYNNNIDSETSAIAFIKFGLAAPANLAFNLFIQGKATVVDKSSPAFIHVKLLLNNAELPYSPLIAPVVFDRIVLGAPLTLAKLQSGSNTLSILATAINSKIVVGPNGLQLTVSGKNIEGGMGTEPPHAEIEDTIPFTYINTNLYKNITSTVSTTLSSKIDSETVGDTLDPSILKSATPINETISVDIIRYGEYISVTNMTLPTGLSVIGDKTCIDYEHTSNVTEGNLFNGYSYSGAIQTDGNKTIESVRWW